MDTARDFDDEDRFAIDDDVTDAGVDDPAFDLGGDERRMHVRAYNHWVSLLKGRPYPSIEDLDPANIADFGPNSVLLDFSGGIEDPTIAFLGRELREECALDSDIRRIADVPSRSLLSRLTDHYLQIIANRAPIGFEAEFVGTRGRITMYRGILMPFSSNGEVIDFIYGVINWKEVVDTATQATLDAELDAAVRSMPKTASHDAPIWADSPSAHVEDHGTEHGDADDASEPLGASGDLLLSGTLADRLSLARESAAQVRAADTRSRAALYRTLARAHDFALAAEADADSYAELLEDAGLVAQARAPMTPVVKLVFGGDYDKTRLTEYAAVLQHARRQGVGAGGLADFLDAAEGGIKGVVAAERAAKRPAKPAADDPATLFERVRAELRDRPSLAPVAMDADQAEFVVLLARANAEGTLDIVARVDEAGTVDAVIRRAAA
jgi:hypothetical protein